MAHAGLQCALQPARRSTIPSILLIRHAQASFGTADYDVLSSRGPEQVDALVAGLRRRGIEPERIVCGALRRQRDTAALCAAEFGLGVSVDERWNEYDERDILPHYASVPVGLDRRPGDEALSSREFQQILNEALRGWIGAGPACPCREPWQQFLARLTAALGELAEGLGKGQTALVISSGGAIGALTAALLRLPPEALIAFNHVSINTGVSKLTVGRGGTTLISSNEHAHLEEADASLITYR